MDLHSLCRAGELGLGSAKFTVRDLWGKLALGSPTRHFAARLNPHGAGLYQVLP